MRFLLELFSGGSRPRLRDQEGDAIPRFNTVRHQPMSEARGTGGDLIEAQNLVGSVRMRNAHRGATRSIGVPADALVGDIEVFAITVEQIPERLRIGELLSVGIAGIFSEFGHRSVI